MKEIIKEYSSSDGANIKIDKTSGVIYDVKILGTVSKNNREYPVSTLREAASLYENARVNLDHPDGDPRKPRSYQDRLGVIRDVKLMNEDGLYANFHFNPMHPLAEQLIWDAEHYPENVGFSHNVEAVLSRKENRVVVDKIVAVRSVDLVADPATTSGLFEAEKTDELSTPTSEINTAAIMRRQLEETEKAFSVCKRNLASILMLCEAAVNDYGAIVGVIGKIFSKPFLDLLCGNVDENIARELIRDRLNLVKTENINLPTLESIPTSKARILFDSNNDRPDDAASFVAYITS